MQKLLKVEARVAQLTKNEIKLAAKRRELTDLLYQDLSEDFLNAKTKSKIEQRIAKLQNTETAIMRHRRKMETRMAREEVRVHDLELCKN